MKSLFDCMIKHSYYANWIVHKLLKKKLLSKELSIHFMAADILVAIYFWYNGFLHFKFCKDIDSHLFWERKKRERKRERGRSGGREERELILNLFRVRNGNLSAYYVHKSRRCWPQSVFIADKLARLRCYPGKSEP